MAAPLDSTWLEEYKLTIDSIHRESGHFWTRFAIFFGSDATILIGLVALKQQGLSLHLEISLALFGSLVSIVWFLVLANTTFWHSYWVSHAREIERDHPVSIVSGSDQYSQNHRVLGFLKRIGEQQWYPIVPAIFAVIFWLVLLPG